MNWLVVASRWRKSMKKLMDNKQLEEYAKELWDSVKHTKEINNNIGYYYNYIFLKGYVMNFRYLEGKGYSDAEIRDIMSILTEWYNQKYFTYFLRAEGYSDNPKEGIDKYLMLSKIASLTKCDLVDYVFNFPIFPSVALDGV